MMCAGGLVAAVGFAGGPKSATVELMLWKWGRVEIPVYQVGALSGLVLALGFLFVVLPPVFRRVVGVIAQSHSRGGARRGSAPERLAALPGSLLVVGRLDSAGIEPARCDPFVRSRGVRFGFCAGTGAGGHRLGGAGHGCRFRGSGASGRARGAQGVLLSALSPALGKDNAVVAALSLRLVWVAAELVAAAVFFPWFQRPSAKAGLAPAGAQHDP